MKDEKVDSLCRRDFLTATGAAFAGLAFGTSKIVRADQVKPAPEKSKVKRVLRFAHMTDIHLQPEKGADKGLTTCLHHAQNLKDPPKMIITGGDTIMDSLATDDARTTLQWNLFHKIMKNECSIPVKSCIGNHDVWGWDREKSKTTGSEALWGKKRAVKELNIPDRYYSFDHAGWHFIFLDSTYADEKTIYIAKLDTEQFEWLKSDLKKTPSQVPVLIVTHEPILSVASFFCSDCEETGNWLVPAAWMHIDARSIKDLLKEHTNVKLCISGHMHLVDQVNYLDTNYVCGGAVCGKWWDGNHQECDEGYGIFDLYDDGGFDYQYVSFGWKPIK